MLHSASRKLKSCVRHALKQLNFHKLLQTWHSAPPNAAPANAARPRPEGNEHRRERTGRDVEARRAYEETFTTLLMAQGMPTMMARVLTCLSTADAGGSTVSEFIARLRATPASIPKAIGSLESEGPVRRERDERRRERYFVDDDVWYRSGREVLYPKPETSSTGAAESIPDRE